MPSIRVVPSDLTASATRLDGHTYDFHAGVRRAHGRMEDARPGIPSRATGVLTTALEVWRQETLDELARLSAFGEALRTFATTVTSIDDANGEALSTDSAKSSARDAP